MAGVSPPLKKGKPPTTGGGAPVLAPAIVHKAVREPGAPLDSIATVAIKRSPFDFSRVAVRSEGDRSGAAGAVGLPDEPAEVEARSIASASGRGRRSAYEIDFSDVRIHTGRVASRAAAAIRAHAFTLGRDIVFGEGRYVPTSVAGQTLLAHELTHVAQNRASPQSAQVVRRSESSEQAKEASSASDMDIGIQGDADARAVQTLRNVLSHDNRPDWLEWIVKAIEALHIIDTIISIAEVIVEGAATTTALPIAAGALLPIGSGITLTSQYGISPKLTRIVAIGYTITAWTFDDPPIAALPESVRLSLKNNQQLESLSVHQDEWRDAASQATGVLVRMSGMSPGSKEAVRRDLRHRGTDRQGLCRIIFNSLADTDRYRDILNTHEYPK